MDALAFYDLYLAQLTQRVALFRSAVEVGVSDRALDALALEIADAAEYFASGARVVPRTGGKVTEDPTGPGVVEETIFESSGASRPFGEALAQAPAEGKKRGRPRKTEAAAVEAPAPAPEQPHPAVVDPAAGPVEASPDPEPAEPAPAVPAAPPSEPKRMTGPDRRATPEPLPPPTEADVAQSRASIVSPDAERVLKETGDAFRASEARRIAEEAAKKPPAAPAPAAAPPSSTLLRAIPPKPEDAMLPFKNGPFLNMQLGDCTIEDLETLVANYVRLIPADPDASTRAQKSAWFERILTWHAYRLESFLATAEPEALRSQVFLYEQLLGTPHATAAVDQHRKTWLAVALAWKAQRDATTAAA